MKHSFNKILRPLILFSTFVLAVIFVFYIHIQTYGSFNLLSSSNKKVIYNVPVVNNLLSKTFSISQVPTSADVEVQGNSIELEEVTKKTLFQLYLPNIKLEQGDNTLEIKVRNNSNSLKVNVLNKFINVKADRIEKKTVKIFPQLINEQVLDKKFVEKVVLSDKEVVVNSSKSILDMIQYGSVLIDLTNLKVGENSYLPTIIMYDKSGKKVNDTRVDNKVNVKVILGEHK